MDSKPTADNQSPSWATFLAGIGIGFVVAVTLGLSVALFASLGAEASPPAMADDPALLVSQGEAAATAYGCAACHSVDGTPGIGPSWLAVAGSDRPLADGTSVVADTDYLVESILDPSAQIVADFDDAMPKGLGDVLSAEDLDAVVAYIESLGG